MRRPEAPSRAPGAGSLGSRRARHRPSPRSRGSELVEEVHLLARCRGEERRREDLTERQMCGSPALPHQDEERFAALGEPRVLLHAPAPRTASHEDQRRHALRVLHGVRNGHETRWRGTEIGEPLSVDCDLHLPSNGRGPRQRRDRRHRNNARRKRWRRRDRSRRNNERHRRRESRCGRRCRRRSACQGRQWLQLPNERPRAQWAWHGGSIARRPCGSIGTRPSPKKSTLSQIEEPSRNGDAWPCSPSVRREDCDPARASEGSRLNESSGR